MGLRGPKSSFDEKHTPPFVKYMARQGLTLPEIANELHISARQLSRWSKKYPEISQALKEGRDSADSAVEDSLYRRACGYEYDETKTVLENDGQGGTRIRTVERVKKHIAPDVAACFIWLKNRKPKIWKERPDAPVTSDELVTKADEALASAACPPGAIPPVPRPSPVQAGSGGAQVGQDGAVQAQVGAGAMGLSDTSPTVG